MSTLFVAAIWINIEIEYTAVVIDKAANRLNLYRRLEKSLGVHETWSASMGLGKKDMVWEIKPW